MKRSFCIRMLLLSILVPWINNATLLVQTTGPGSYSIPPFTFNQPLMTATFDRATGTFYAGLAAGGGTFAISKASRQQGSVIPAFAGIATNSGVNNQPIEYIRIATDYGSTSAPLLAGAVENNGTPKTATSDFLMTTDGSFLATSKPILDAAGNTTSGIWAMDANSAFVFTAVAPAAQTSPPILPQWGQVNSGIAAQIIYQTVNTATFATILGLQQSFNQPFVNAVQAAEYDPNSPAIQIQDPPTLDTNITIRWDSKLGKLYMAVTGTTANVAAGDGLFSVAVGTITPGGTIFIEPFLINAGALIDGQTDKIIAARQLANVPLHVGVRQVHIMHNTTGPTYLITAGDYLENAQNVIYALPVVDVGQETSPIQGLLANKNAFNPVTHRFETPALANADLTSNTDVFAQVGAGPLPVQASQGPSFMWVVEDTVYVSIDAQPFSINEDGVFYSQAMFDETGKIIRWTPWTKHAFPYYGFSTETLPGPIKVFFVDAYNGNVWAVNDYSLGTVAITTWDKGFNTPKSLPAVLNNNFTDGTFSVLDLDQSTRGFTACQFRYALFGGAAKVGFAVISGAVNPPQLNSAQLVNADFSSPDNFLITQLPVGAGAVTVLEYARQLTGTNSNYFFAGTNLGLFAYTTGGGNGFDVSSLNLVDKPVIFGGVWESFPDLPGAIIDIKTTGNMLYVLTYQSTKANPFLYTLYRMPFAPNIATMSANKVVIAQTNVDIFAQVRTFNGIQIIATQPNGSTEQLVMATSDGLYQSARAGGVQNATSQTDAHWELIKTTNGSLYNTIGYIDNAPVPTRPPSTVWPINVTDFTNCKSFSNSLLNQLAGSQDNVPFNFVPTFFTSNQPFNKTVNTIEPINYFWSDGARRFIIARNTGEFGGNNHIIVLPYDLVEWGVTNLEDQFIDSGVPLTVNTFYWLRPIGASGIILAGTDSGVIALE